MVRAITVLATFRSSRNSCIGLLVNNIRINCYAIDFRHRARVRVCVRVRIRTRTHTHAHQARKSAGTCPTDIVVVDVCLGLFVPVTCLLGALPRMGK